MPGSVSNATPSTVLPQILARAFSRSQEYIVIANEYRNGESQRRRVTETSRKTWRFTRRMTTAQLQALRNFYFARHGAHQPFYAYDPLETVPKFSHDPTGVDTNGRYTVRFASDWNQSVFAGGRAEATIQFVEVA